jgi:hypothetical protein
MRTGTTPLPVMNALSRNGKGELTRFSNDTVTILGLRTILTLDSISYMPMCRQLSQLSLHDSQDQT